jgi:hypothetical protein
MSKHTTAPLRKWFEGRLRTAYDGPREGNRNEHAKRRMASSLRTFGRASRFAKRHQDEFDAGQHKGWLRTANSKFLAQLREETNNNPEGYEPDCRDHSWS